MVSADSRAYTYLPQSIAAMPGGEVMRQIMEKAGFDDVEIKRLTFGVCTIYTAIKRGN